MSAPDDGKILTDLDAEDLNVCGLLREGSTDKYIRLHKRRLQRFSDDEYQHIPLSLSKLSPAPSNTFAELPAVLISYETLEYVGLSTATATQLWTRWNNWPSYETRRETDPDDGGLVLTFEEYIIGHCWKQTDAVGSDLRKWQQCLNDCGVCVETQERIMDADYDRIRLSKSCLFWVTDTVKMRYAGLKDVQSTSRERAMKLSQNVGQDTSRPSGTQAAKFGQGSDQKGEDNVRSTVLYKGLDRARIKGLFDKRGACTADSLGQISSMGDFSGNRSQLYFSPSLEIAKNYAYYAKIRAQYESVVILCLTIPNQAVETLAPEQIQRVHWPSDEWKKLIWISRTKKRGLKELGKYRQAMLLIGSISTKSDKEYDRLNSWEQITAEYLLKVYENSEEEIQWVFDDETARDWLIENGAQDMRAVHVVIGK